MAVRDIIILPDKRLRLVSEPVKAIDREVKALVADLFETMYDAPGIGLAAIQVGIPRRVVTMDLSKKEEAQEPRVFINPEILSREAEITWPEGCLSFPGVTEEIVRAEKVTVRALDRDGKEFTLSAEGLLAVAIQHEYDHLQGVLMIDHLGPLKKRLVHRKMQKRSDDRPTP